MNQKKKRLLFGAILLGLAFHGATLFFTFEGTYDALIHLFFAEHYSQHWFEPWNLKWYTGFTMLSYPPLVHQCIALLSFIGGLKFGLFSIAFISVPLFVSGVYRFTLLLTGSKVKGGYAAMLCVFSSSFIETLHIFGQLPSVIGIALLLHSLPEVYWWLRTGKRSHLWTFFSLIAMMTCSHHVTSIFGMVFFVFPVVGLAMYDQAYRGYPTKSIVRLSLFLKQLWKLRNRILSMGIGTLCLIIVCIFPYWINSKKNPITQIPIPHGSRDNFFEVASSGFIFFLIPWGFLLLILPYILHRFSNRRRLFFGFSFLFLLLLGTGGTTPIPEFILGEDIFNILTFDRFTFWGSIMALPVFAEFTFECIQGKLGARLKKRIGKSGHLSILYTSFTGYLAIAILTISLGYFRPFQPQKLKMQPLVNFLQKDQHYRWRYMTLGFGDQMAWLSSLTKAPSVDGNYHSARRLPELTSRAIERLENSKFKGIEGIASLQQFLTVPEKFHLKFIFSNDRFYDPILYFCGWHPLQLLENGVEVWEKTNIPPLPKLLEKEDISIFQKVWWGTIPIGSLLFALFWLTRNYWRTTPAQTTSKTHQLPKMVFITTKRTAAIQFFWMSSVLLILLYALIQFYQDNMMIQSNPTKTIKAYFHAMDFKAFKNAHALIDPEQQLSLDQFMLEQSVESGILDTYAKLDSIDISFLKKTDQKAKALVSTKWLTSIEEIQKKEPLNVIKRKGRWYSQLPPQDNDIPPNVYMTQKSLRIYNHCKRKLTTKELYHEDKVSAPKIHLSSAKLIRRNNKYVIIGEVQNIDNIPCEIVFKGTLYNQSNLPLASYNAKHTTKHILMPKETTSFKINFEGMAWSKQTESIPSGFNPDEFTNIDLEDQPSKFSLDILTSDAKNTNYTQVSVNNIGITKMTGEGFLFNAGVDQVVIPQLLISYYNSNKELLWVSHEFIQKNIRQERKQYFRFPIDQKTRPTIVNNSMENCFVNSLPYWVFSKELPSKQKKKHASLLLHPLLNNNFHFLKIELNNFINQQVN